MRFFLPKKTDGISLIELLIYLAVLLILMVGITEIFLITMRVRARSNAMFAVNENARVVLGKMRDAILDGTAVATSGTCPANSLDVTIAGSITRFQVTNGIVEIVEGVNPAKSLTAANVVVSTGASCLFTKMNNPAPAKPTIRIQLRVTYNTPGNVVTEISQDYELAVSLR